MTTSAGGAATGSIGPITGYIHAVRLKGFDGTADLTLTAGGQSILVDTSIDADEFYYPRVPVHAAADGAAISGGYTMALLIGETISVTIANGGNAVAGTVTVDVVPA